MSDAGLFASFLVTLPLLLVSLVAHELAHGFVAARLGDPTARLQGRLTLNPLVHLDTWGSVALVVTFLGSGGTFFFGWAKPVTVIPGNFRDPQRGMMLVGIAGPATNVLLALLAAGLVWLTFSWNLFIAEAFALAFVLNVVLAVINLIPVPPLDGSRVVGGILPAKLYQRWIALDRYGSYVLLGVLALLIVRPEVFDATIGAVLSWSYGVLPGGGS